MTLLRNKKSQFLMYGVMAGLIFGGIVAYIDNIKTKQQFGVIGETSLKLIDLSIESDKAFLYIEQSAKHATYRAIHELAENGGCIGSDTYSGYTLWDFNKDYTLYKCPPNSDDYKNNFIEMFSENLYMHVLKYSPLHIPLSNYNFDFDGKKITGTPIEPLKFQDTYVKGQTEVFYLASSSFETEIDYDFSEYNDLRENAKDLVEVCSNVEDIESCVDSKKNDFFNIGNLELIEECGMENENEVEEENQNQQTQVNIFIFCVKSNKHKFYLYDEESEDSRLKNVIYKFALNFENQEQS